MLLFPEVWPVACAFCMIGSCQKTLHPNCKYKHSP